MVPESLDHLDSIRKFPSEKIFTLQEVKESAYQAIYAKVVDNESRKLRENISPDVYKQELLKSHIYGFFGSLISRKPHALGLPERFLTPEGEKTWSDLPLSKTHDGKISVESIALGETPVFMGAPAQQNLRNYWGIIDLLYINISREVGDISKVKTVRLLQDDNEPFRIRLSGDTNDKVATHGKKSTNILRIEYSDGTEKLINLLDNYRIFTSPHTETERATLARVQKERQALKDGMNREPLFGGSLSYEYVIVGGAGIAGAVFGTLRVVQSIRYRDQEGRTIDMKPTTKIQGSKEQVMGMVGKEMESMGMSYNSRNSIWESILDRALNKIISRLPEMSVSEMNARTGLGITPSRWDTIKANPDRFISKTPYPDIIKKGVKGILNHGILFPLDVLLASEVATYSNSATIFSASSDLAAFYLGQKSLDFIGKFVPGGVGKAMKLLRFPAGIASTIYSNKLWKEALEGNQKKWQHLFQDGFGSVYTDGQSTALNIFGGGFVNFALDQAQKGKKTGEEIYDVGTTPGVISILGLEIPEVNFFQHRIDLATDPGDWLRGHPGRNIDDWNNQIDNHLPHHTLRLIRLFIDRMNSGQYPFVPKKLIELKITKEELLVQILNTILSGGNDPSKGPVDVKGNILIAVERELKGGWKGEASMNKVTEVVYTQVPKLKIDSFFMEHYYPTQILYHQQHIGLLLLELGKYISPEDLAYVSSIQRKMEENKPISDSGKWIKTEILGLNSEKFVPSKTNALFQAILSNTTTIQAVLDLNPKSKPVVTSIGEYFAYILNFLLEQKRRKEFYNEILKGNKKGVQWTL